MPCLRRGTGQRAAVVARWHQCVILCHRCELLVIDALVSSSFGLGALRHAAGRCGDLLATFPATGRPSGRSSGSPGTFRSLVCRSDDPCARRHHSWLAGAGTSTAPTETGAPRGHGGREWRRAAPSRDGVSLLSRGRRTSATRMGGAVARRQEVTATPRCAVEAEGMDVDVVDDAAGRGDGETRRPCCLHGGRPPRRDAGSSGGAPAARARRRRRTPSFILRAARKAWHPRPPCRRAKTGR